jgi:hypothetical protein
MKVNFTARYKKRSNTLIDKFKEYLKFLQEDFDICDPIQWWAGCHAQFPNLFHLVHDILAIPGECHMACSKHLYLIIIFALFVGSVVVVNRFFLGVGTQSPCGMQASSLRPSGH